MGGRVIHLYKSAGQTHTAILGRESSLLQRIELFSNMVSDHKGQEYLAGLNAARMCRVAPSAPPSWQSFEASTVCPCCDADFTWASTSNSAAQQNLDKYNCNSCGRVVCSMCCKREVCLP